MKQSELELDGLEMVGVVGREARPQRNGDDAARRERREGDERHDDTFVWQAAADAELRAFEETLAVVNGAHASPSSVTEQAPQARSAPLISLIGNDRRPRHTLVTAS